MESEWWKRVLVTFTVDEVRYLKEVLADTRVMTIAEESYGREARQAVLDLRVILGNA